MNFTQLIALVIAIIVVRYITQEIFKMPDYWVGYITGTAAMIVMRIFED